MRRTETPKPIWIKLCTVVDIPDVVTYTNFGDHRLRGFWVAGGQISPSPIDFLRRPYNTLALPCERVINDLPEICAGEDPSSEIFLYADDSKIYKVIPNQSDQQKLQTILNMIKSWSDEWLLRLNIMINVNVSRTV